MFPILQGKGTLRSTSLLFLMHALHVWRGVAQWFFFSSNISCVACWTSDYNSRNWCLSPCTLPLTYEQIIWMDTWVWLPFYYAGVWAQFWGSRGETIVREGGILIIRKTPLLREIAQITSRIYTKDHHYYLSLLWNIRSFVPWLW